MSLRQIRGRVTMHLYLSLKETVTLAERAVPRTPASSRRVAADLNAGLPHPLIERPDMDAAVFRDLRGSDVRLTVLGDADHVVAELFRERLGPDDILPGQPLG